MDSCWALKIAVAPNLNIESFAFSVQGAAFAVATQGLGRERIGAGHGTEGTGALAVAGGAEALRRVLDHRQSSPAWQ